MILETISRVLILHSNLSVGQRVFWVGTTLTGVGSNPASCFTHYNGIFLHSVCFSSLQEHKGAAFSPDMDIPIYMI